MTRAMTLEYEKHATPNRYEWEMETERARWLRRRFLWFTGTLVVVALILLLSSVAEMVTSSAGLEQSAAAVDTAVYLVQIGAAGWAWWYARQRTRNERRLFAIAFWLVVGLGVLGMFAKRGSGDMRYTSTINRLEANEVREANKRASGLDDGIGAGRSRGAEGFVVDPETGIPAVRAAPRQAAPPAPVARWMRSFQYVDTLRTISFAVFVSHLLACLFLPWTVREATRPALILLGAAAFLVVCDLLLGRASFWYLGGAVILLPLTVLPGIGWSWWRYSRFRRKFRSVFESNQLRQLTTELSGARRIHEATLPPVHDEGPIRLSYIYEPMSQIGGDLLYVHPLPAAPTNYDDPHDRPPPPRHTAVLLDVTGHGIAAALTVNRLIGELERIFAESPNIGTGELIGALNRYVFLTLARHGVFVTGLAVSVDTTESANCAACYRDAHAVTFASAGHPTAFLRRADGRLEPLESNSTMLGVLPPEEYEPEEHVFRLRPGEAIVAYTDGALEARNLEDEMIGIEGVRDLIGRVAQETIDPHHWPEQLIRRVAAWRNAPPADDTLIACVYRPPVPAELMTEREPDASVPEAVAVASV